MYPCWLYDIDSWNHTVSMSSNSSLEFFGVYVQRLRGKLHSLVQEALLAGQAWECCKCENYYLLTPHGQSDQMVVTNIAYSYLNQRMTGQIHWRRPALPLTKPCGPVHAMAALIVAQPPPRPLTNSSQPRKKKDNAAHRHNQPVMMPMRHQPRTYLPVFVVLVRPTLCGVTTPHACIIKQYPTSSDQTVAPVKNINVTGQTEKPL